MPYLFRIILKKFKAAGSYIPFYWRRRITDLSLEAQSQLRPFYFVVRSRRIVNIALYRRLARSNLAQKDVIKTCKPQQHAECFGHVRRTSYTRRGTGFYPRSVNSKWPTMRRKKQLMIENHEI